MNTINDNTINWIEIIIEQIIWVELFIAIIVWLLIRLIRSMQNPFLKFLFQLVIVAIILLGIILLSLHAQGMAHRNMFD